MKVLELVFVYNFPTWQIFVKSYIYTPISFFFPSNSEVVTNVLLLRLHMKVAESLNWWPNLQENVPSCHYVNAFRSTERIWQWSARSN